MMIIEPLSCIRYWDKCFTYLCSLFIITALQTVYLQIGSTLGALEPSCSHRDKISTWGYLLQGLCSFHENGEQLALVGRPKQNTRITRSCRLLGGQTKIIYNDSGLRQKTGKVRMLLREQNHVLFYCIPKFWLRKESPLLLRFSISF